MKTVIIDNYDSFTYNLYQYVGEIDERPVVVRNDEITLDGVRRLRPDRIIISPGPGSPEDPGYFGVCKRVLLELGPTVPLLGVCLGHQGIIHVFGGRIVRAKEVMHGKTSYITHDNRGVFRGLSRSFEAMRYHSLVGDPSSIPDCLEVSATTSDGIVMGVRHRQYPIEGIQFHPESVGTPVGKQLLGNFVGGAARHFDGRAVNLDGESFACRS